MPDSVGPHEHVYRMVRYNRGYYQIDEGKVTVSSEAFSDPRFKPSVDRADLGSPKATQRADENAVVRLSAAGVRQLGPIQELDAKARPVFQHAVDIVPDPLPATAKEPANPAHALIVVVPEYRKPKPNSEFKKLKIALARLAEESGVWVFEPYELRSSSGSWR